MNNIRYKSRLKWTISNIAIASVILSGYKKTHKDHTVNSKKMS